MAAILNRSFGRLTGYDNLFSGMFNSRLFCPSPSGFAVNFNPLDFRSKNFCFPNCSPFPPAIFSCRVPSAFRRPWSNHHSASLATVCSSLRSYLQISFPHHVLPLLPALAHPCSLIPFLSALVSVFVSPLFPCPTPMSCNTLSQLYCT